jgi:hypothetical protein
MGMETNGHPVSAASGEPEVKVHGAQFRKVCGSWRFVSGAMLLMVSTETNHVLDALVEARAERDATERLCAQHEGKIHELRDLLADCAQQRDAAVRELEETRKREALSDAIVDECDSDITKLVQERASLRAQLAAAQRVQQQYADLIAWMLGENGSFPSHPDHVSGKPYPLYWWRWELRRRHEEILTPTPPQDAATTRGEG